MKHILPFALAALLLSSCGTYQMMTVNSENVIRDEKSGGLVAENDSIKITYTFNGDKSPVGIEVRNKLNKPLYIDWQRSALIYKDSAISFTGSKVAINLSTDLYWSGQGPHYQTVNASGDALLPQYTEFIPPNAYIKREPIRMPGALITNVSDTVFHQVKIESVMEGRMMRADKAVFTKDNSPVAFTTYLTFYTDDNKAKPIVYTQRFYVTEVLKIKHHPAQTVYYTNVAGDKFYSFLPNN